ncbi:ATP-binding protein [Woodsholea maritima]|uniref:ATP-binding protein n=1 Tax=Woodsholea maritima TaxID=240237 RepID=UPI0003792AA6|nr:ATP-binding protein [Woodsholea maritima]
MRDLLSLLKPYSLRTRLIALATLIAFVSASAVGLLAYKRVTQVTYSLAVDNLGRQTEIISTRLGEAFRNMHTDAIIVSHTPPIQGVIRTIRAGGADPLDGSSLELWRTRLETIFIAMMETRPYYTQMRYVGIDDRGREIVRVNANQRGFERVSPDHLQRKQNEPYFQEGMKLNPGELYYSEVTFNRENGRIDPSLTPTIRIIVPIFNENVELFGMIVINANYDTLIQDQILDISPNVDTIISNNTGDYFIFDGYSRSIISSQYTLNNVYDPDPAITYAIAHPEDTSFSIQDTINYKIRYWLNPSIQNSYIDIITQIDQKEATQHANSIKYESILTICIASILMTSIAFALAHFLTTPLLVISKEMRRYRQAQSTQTPIFANDLNLPLDQKDEIGILAQTFQKLVRELEEREAKNRSILENISEAILVFNHKGEISYSNGSCEILFQLSRDQISHKLIHELFPNLISYNTDNINASLMQNTYEIIGKNTETIAQRANNTIFPADIIISEIITPQDELFCLTARDISDRKQIDIIKNDLISKVNIEIRAPLSNIFKSIESLMLNSREIMPPNDYSLLESAHNSCRKLSHLVNDILDVEKMSSGRLAYNCEDVNIIPLVKECVEHHLGLAQTYGVHFHLETEVETAWVHLDPNRFNQALLNLLSNAAKFSPSGESVTIRVKLSGQHHVRISVSDNGPGIPKAFRDKVFDRFTQADSSHSNQNGSSGLGLHITKTLIEAFHGSVTFDTVEGRGTTFHFLLPIVQPH